MPNSDDVPSIKKLDNLIFDERKRGCFFSTIDLVRLLTKLHRKYSGHPWINTSITQVEVYYYIHRVASDKFKLNRHGIRKDKL